MKLARAVSQGQPVLPLSRDTVEGVAAALKEAGMRSGSQYLAELRLIHVEAGYEVQAWLKRAFDLCRSGLDRERGPVKRAREVRVESEAVDKLKKTCHKRACPQHGGLMFLWACIWMLREIEARNMKLKDVRTLSCCGHTPCKDVCPVKLAIAVVSLAKKKTNTWGMPLFTDAKGLFVSKQGVIACWKAIYGQETSGHSPRRSGAMYYVRQGLPIQELAFLGRWKSSVVLVYAEEALQEKPMTLPGTLEEKPVEDKNKTQKASSKADGGPRQGQKTTLALQQAFGKPKDLWVVTKGRGWKGRPRHLVTKATWNLPVKEWSTACGWSFAANSSEFYFLTGAQVDKMKRGIMSVAKQYGQDYLVLRGVRLRTTFSDRDSCTQGQQASCEWYAHVLEKYTDPELQAVTEVALGDRLFVDSSVLDTAAGGYKEVQIHGEVEFKKHLEAVVVHHSRKKSKVLYSGIVEWCNSIGVPLLCMPEFCDGTALICGQSNPGTQLTAETPLWRWRPEKSTGPWVRFDAVASSVLEARRRRETVEFPCMPVGQISNLNMAAMTASLLIGNMSVELALQRRTAGEGAKEQEAGAAGAAGCAIWEWCASASGHGAWCRYADTVSSALEKAWKSKTSHTWFRVEESTYQLDFELMVQVNCETKYRRLVRRRNNGS
eukprot:s648_g36.t1